MLVACESKSGQLHKQQQTLSVKEPEKLVINDSLKIVVERKESDGDIRYVLLLNGNKILLKDKTSYIWSYHSSHTNLNDMIDYMLWLYTEEQYIERTPFIWSD